MLDDHRPDRVSDRGDQDRARLPAARIRCRRCRRRPTRSRRQSRSPDRSPGSASGARHGRSAARARRRSTAPPRSGSRPARRRRAPRRRRSAGTESRSRRPRRRSASASDRRSVPSSPARQDSASRITAAMQTRVQATSAAGIPPRTAIRISRYEQPHSTDMAANANHALRDIDALPVTAALGGDFDLGDLQHAHAARGRHPNLLATLVAEQRLADGRLVGQLQFGRVGLGRPDDRVLGRLAGLVLDVDDGADRDDLGVEIGGVDDRCRAKLLLELRDVGLESRLLVLGVVVFGVLGDVAELTRLLDARGDLAPSGRGQALVLRPEVGEALPG